MSVEREPWEDTYHFYEREFDSYADLRDWFEWSIPGEFNIAAYTCDRWAKAHPDRTAVFAENAAGDRETYTYRDLDRATDRLANALETRGVGRGDRVGINVPQRAETLLTYLATWKLGAVTVPLSTRFGRDALSYRLGDCQVRAAVVDETRTEAFAAAANDVEDLSSVLVVDLADADHDDAIDANVDDFWTAVEATSTDRETVTTRADDDAMIIYTSGTTGDPKGVRHAHSFLLGHLPSVVTAFFNLDPKEVERFYTPVEWAWVGPIWAFTLPALFYGKQVVAYDGGRFDPEETLELFDRYDVTRTLGPTTVWRRLEDVEDPAERFDVESLEVVVSAGESMAESSVEWIEETFGGAVVHEGYGQTEAMELIMDCSALFPARPDKMGKPTPGVDVELVDVETGEVGVEAGEVGVEAGEVGEIACWYGDGHPLCLKEYWNKPEKTAAKVQDGWLLTEDLGFVDDDGYYEFVSRKDDVIICSGYRIGPEEVEESLADHEAVAVAGVIGVPEEAHGEVPKAFVVLRNGYAPSSDLTDELKAHVKSTLAMYEYPRRIEYVEELPTTGSGKVARAELREWEGIQ